MTNSNIVLGSQTIVYNTDTLVITSAVDYRTAQNEAVSTTSFGDNDNVFRFDITAEIDCIAFTGGESYVGNYAATVANY